MKKLALLLAVIMMLSVVLVACNNDDGGETESNSTSESVSESKSNTDSDTESESVSESKSDTDSETDSETNSETTSETNSETNSETDSETTSETTSETDSETESESKPLTKPEDNSVANNSETTSAQTSPDIFYIDGVQQNNQAGGEAAHKWLESKGWTIEDTTASMSTLAFFGWTNTENIVAFGYEINGVQVWDAAKINSYVIVDNGVSYDINTDTTANNIAPDMGLSSAFANAKRAFVEVNVGNLEAGWYNINILVKLADDSVYAIGTWGTTTYIKYGTVSLPTVEAKENVIPVDEDRQTCCDSIFWNLDEGASNEDAENHEKADQFLCTATAHKYLAENDYVIVNNGEMQTIGFWGWSKGLDIAAFGCEINGEEYWSCPGDGLAEINDTLSYGFTRMNVIVDISGWAAGEYTMSLLFKTTDGTVAALPGWNTFLFVNNIA